MNTTDGKYQLSPFIHTYIAFSYQIVLVIEMGDDIIKLCFVSFSWAANLNGLWRNTKLFAMFTGFAKKIYLKLAWKYIQIPCKFY